MKLKQTTMVPLLTVAALALIVAGCASNSSAPPPPPPPPVAAQPQPYVPPPKPALSADEMSKLCHANPDTCHSVQTAQPLTLDDIKVLAKFGFGPDTIITLIRNSQTVYHLSANQIIDLKNAGVDNHVLDFMITTQYAIGGSTPMPESMTNYGSAQTPPPEPPPETAPPSPGPDYVWVGGDWVWNGSWVWAGGHWVVPPYPGAIWLHGRWGRGWNGYRRVPGHWRR